MQLRNHRARLSMVLLFLAVPFWLATRPAAHGDGPAKPGAPAGLAEDTAAAKVAEREGMVFVKRALSERWVLAREGSPITPGDQVKTAARGANAAELRLAGGAQVVLGPGGLLEIGEAGLIRLRRGDLDV